MEKVLIIGIAIFLVIIFLFWKLTSGPMKKEYGNLLFKQWTSQLYYWQSAIYASVGVTILIMFLLRWVDIVNF